MNREENTATDETLVLPSLFMARLKFAFKNYRWPIILTGLFLAWALIDGLSGWQIMDGFKTRWNTDIDQIVSLATLMIALFVWYGEIAEDWKNNLPKRLTVRFETIEENNTTELVMMCIKAHLSDVADVRALGQQIAKQMCEGKELMFRAPYVKQNAGEILHDSEIGHFLHYKVTFTLTKSPDGLSKGQCKLWRAPFGTEDLQIKDNNQRRFRSNNFHSVYNGRLED